MGELGRGWCRGRARRAAPGPCGRQGRKRPPAEPGAGGSFAVLADELPDEGALRDELGADGEEVAVAFQQALYRTRFSPASSICSSRPVMTAAYKNGS